ncbi:MAG: BlaI/MecI/CopY family transcriptional regulator, partial [Oscillospiraceae bacterium]
EYTAVVSAADYQATQAKALLDKLYEGDAKGLVSTLIQRELLSRQDVEELRAMWESGVAHE